MFWVRSDLDSGKNFISGGGVFWNQIPGGGRGLFWNQIPEQGCSGEFGQKFLETYLGSLTCWCITDSLSHTTYVETNKL